jgi:SNF2 family DNA or RNA helicase
MKWQPYKYQVRSAKFLLDRGGAGLWLDPGLGKTSITLAALSALKDADKLDRALIIAPLRVAQLTWPVEVMKWDDFRHLKLTVLHGKDKDWHITRNADINVVNPEGLDWLVRAAPKPWPWNVLVVDESTKFKNWSAQRTKLLRTVLDRFERRWTLTGTPAPNGLQDVFSQAFIMDGGHALGAYITHFRQLYMYPVGPIEYGQYLPREGSWEEVAAKLRPLVLRLEAKDWLELPELSYNVINIELPPPARKLYNQLEKDFFLKVEQGDVVAGNAAALGTKLRQATNGIVYTDGEDHHVLHKEKLSALEDLLEELGGSPILVAVAFRTEVVEIQRYLGKKIPYLGGGVSASEANRIVSEWNKGKIPVLLAHPTSVAHGLNLQFGAHHVCWFGLTWNFEEYDQFIRRVWRHGQKNRVVVHQIIAKDTMDQPIGQALCHKDKQQSSLMQLVKNYKPKK